MKGKKNRGKPIEKVSKILLTLICVVSSIFQFNKIISANQMMLAEHMELINQNKEFIILFVCLFQIIVAITSVYIDAVLIAVLTKIILKRKEYIKTSVLPATFGNMVAIIVNVILLYSINDYSITMLRQINIIPIALGLKVVLIFFILYKKYKIYEKKESVILGGSYFVIMAIGSMINILTI